MHDPAEEFSEFLTEQLQSAAKKTRTSKKQPHPSPSLKASLSDYEEAFTVLKSIQSAHSPLSYTAISAYLHYRRGIDTTRRSAPGVVWPEHPQSFSGSRLMSGGQADYNQDLAAESDKQDGAVGLCEMAANPNLHSSLLRTCQSIYRQKTLKEIDPKLSRVIAKRCALLLQTVFSRSLLNRRSASKILSNFPQTHNMDTDNVPVNWEGTKAAARQLINQAALDAETFSKFSSRLHSTFEK